MTSVALAFLVIDGLYSEHLGCNAGVLDLSEYGRGVAASEICAQSNLIEEKRQL